VKLRQDRVAEEVRDAVAAALRDMKDPRLGLVSVVRAEMSADLTHAKIKVSRFGDAEAVRESEKALIAATGFVRTRVAKAVRLRQAPEIHWVMDDSIAYSQKIDTLLKEIHGKDAK